MYIETVKRTTKNKQYAYTLLRRSYRDPITKKTKNETLLNLTNWPAEKIVALRLLVENKNSMSETEAGSKSGSDIKLRQGKEFGGLWLFYELAKQSGLEKALGKTRHGKIALLLIIGRILTQRSRLHIYEWVKQQEVESVLGISSISKDELYRTLDWLSANQEEIEKKLYAHSHQGAATQSQSLYLYDVTSSYLEGLQNELGEYGYNRDQKKGKKQIVIGLLTNNKGMPVAVSTFKGNTSDTQTVTHQIESLANRFKVKSVIMVGDRGMIKGPQKQALNDVEFNYITAITKKQIETLIRKDIIQISLFDSELAEVTKEAKRYILRRNPIRREEIRFVRSEKITSLRNRAQKATLYLETHPKGKLSLQEQKLTNKIHIYGCQRFCSVVTQGRCLSIKLDEKALDECAVLDGCYVLETDISSTSLDTQSVHDRYKDLAHVELAFRTMKTACLEIRPIFVRKESRTRGHVFVTMLAYSLVKLMWDPLKASGATKLQCMDLIKSIQTVWVEANGIVIKRVPEPSGPVQKILDALNLKLPLVLSR